jgi:hypothetical protein
MRKSSMRGRSFISLPYFPFFISKYLSSMRKFSMRERSFNSLFYQQLPEFYEEILHEGEELRPPFL